VASLASLAYTFIVWMGLSLDGHPEVVGSNLKSVISAGDPVFYSIFLHILIYYLIAFISGYLAERLRQRDRQLADTSRALQKAKLETDDILTHLNSGLLTIDATGRIIFFNRAAERILGYHEEDVKGLNCEEAFADRMPHLAQLLTDGLRENRSHPRREIAIHPRCRSDQTIPLGLSTSCLTEPDGSIRGVIAIFSDLTEAKQLEAKVRAADRLAAVGELSASIAHEIRNPLATISGSVEVLKADLDVEGEDARLMELIVKESDRLSKITTEFLTYARVSEPNLAKVELCHLVGDVIQILRHHPSYHPSHTIDLHTESSIVYVVGDGDLIKQMLINLGVNALEAIGENQGRLDFRLLHDESAGQVNLYIEDTGPGIDPENLKHIYQPFFSTKKQGTGLGLAIVHRMAQAMKLGLHPENGTAGGAVFRIEFCSYEPVALQSTSSPDRVAPA
jgi:two-component system sensor histidine kinase PilS (NtrC family)